MNPPRPYLVKPAPDWHSAAPTDLVRMNHAHAERARVLAREQRRQQTKAQDDIKFMASLEHVQATTAAYSVGCEQGEHTGYMKGWSRGLCVGACLSVLSLGAVLLATGWPGA